MNLKAIRTRANQEAKIQLLTISLHHTMSKGTRLEHIADVLALLESSLLNDHHEEATLVLDVGMFQ
jgi:hypothetical protein